MLVTVGMIM